MITKRAVEHMLALSGKSDDPLNLILCSPGGPVELEDMLHNMIKLIKPKVRCIGSGWVASSGALIFIGAALKNRYCLPNTRFLLHQPSGGFGGQACDMKIQAEQGQARGNLGAIYKNSSKSRQSHSNFTKIHG